MGNIGLFVPGYPLCRDIHYASSIDALEKTGALVLLGADHFYRSTGVLNRLKNMGWTLSRVPCPAWVDPMLPEDLSSRVFQEYIDLVNERRCPECKGSGKEELGAWGDFFADASVPKPDCTTCNGSGFVLPEKLKSGDRVLIWKGEHQYSYGVVMDPVSEIHRNKQQWRVTVRLDNGKEIAVPGTDVDIARMPT